MSLKIRRAIFYLYISLFLLIAPVVVLYTAGYRLDLHHGRLVQVGAMSVTTIPRGASVWLDGQLLSSRTPTLQKRLLPGTYDLELRKDGFRPWHRQIEVKSRQTTVIENVALFLLETPELIHAIDPTTSAANHRGVVAYLTQAGAWIELWLYDPESNGYVLLDRLSSSRVVAPSLYWSHDDYLLIMTYTDSRTVKQRFYNHTGPIETPQWFADYTLEDLGDAVALERRHGENKKTVALLPPGEYFLSEVKDNLVTLIDPLSERLVLVDANTVGPPILLEVNASLFTFADALLFYSDGFEIHRYDLTNSTDTLMTRSSAELINLRPFTTNQTLLITRSTEVSAVDVSDVSRPVTTALTSAENIQTFWTDVKNQTGYFFGTVDGLRGLYRLPLVE